MALWRPNPLLYGPGGGEFVDDAGQVWPDPWGTLAPVQEQPAVQPSQQELVNGMGQPGGQLQPQQVQEFLQQTQPPQQPADVRGTHEVPPPEPAINSPEGMSNAIEIPEPQPGLADRLKAQGGAGIRPPDPQPGFADQKLIDQSTVRSTSTTTDRGETGLSDEAQARQAANIGQVAQAQNEAVQAKQQAMSMDQQIVMQSAKQQLAAASNELQRNAARIAVVDSIQAEVDRKMQAASNWMPDRSQLFSGDGGALKGVLAAVAAMAGGWMQGRGLVGGNPFLPTIFKLIDDNVSDQIRRNSATMQFLREQKGDLKAAALELKQRQLALVERRATAMATIDRHPAVQAGAMALVKELQAKNVQWEQEKRQSLERNVTSKVSRTLNQSTTTGPAGGGDPRLRMQQVAQGSLLRRLDRVIDTLKSADKSGALQSVVGWQAKLGANSLQEFFGGLPPEQQKALTALRELEVLNREEWAREPNGTAVQERLSQIGIPQNDRDIGIALQRLEAIRADKLLDILRVPVDQSTDPTLGVY